MITKEIRSYIINNFKGIESGKYIRRIECPACRKREAWASTENPFIIFCPRKNECGESTKIRDIAPRLFNFPKHYPATKARPNYPAEMYLEGRGISRNIIDKVSFEYVGNIKREGKNLGAAIMWDLGKGLKSGRLMYPPVGEGKSHHQGKVGGHLWGSEYISEWNKPIYLVEGIIDAMSLMSAGHQALAYLSCNYTPNFSALKGKIKHVIIGPDNDSAGLKVIDKFTELLRDLDMEIQIAIALPPEGEDWNDLAQKSLNEKVITDCTYRGELAKAENPMEFVGIYKGWTGREPAIFEMWGRTWFCWQKPVKKDCFETQVDKIGNFTIRLEKTIHTYDEQGRLINMWKVKLTGYDGKQTQFEMRGKEIATINRARETFASLGAVAYDPGPTKHHAAFVEYIFKQKAKHVRRMSCFGIDDKTGAFITSKFCVHNGKMTAPRDGHLKIGNEEIEPLDMDNMIKPKESDSVRILSLMLGAFGTRGRIALGWWFGSLFRDDFIERNNFYPFLSCYGEAQTGKSTLALFLSRLSGHDREGFPISKDMTTSKALIRNLSKFSGTPFNILEGNEI